MSRLQAIEGEYFMKNFASLCENRRTGPPVRLERGPLPRPRPSFAQSPAPPAVSRYLYSTGTAPRCQGGQGLNPQKVEKPASFSPIVRASGLSGPAMRSRNPVEKLRYLDKSLKSPYTERNTRVRLRWEEGYISGNGTHWFLHPRPFPRGSAGAFGEKEEP